MKLVEQVGNAGNAVDPSFQKWIDLVTLGVSEAQDSAWTSRLDVHPSRPVDAPLLHMATVRIDPDHAASLVMRIAGELGIVNGARVDPLAVMLAGIERDHAINETLAERLAVAGDTVAVLSQLCALPVLLNAARQLDPEASRTWQRGYCPVCGAWPALAEMRGIQRERRMRCGCCSSDWMLPVLRCAFCNELDHNKLGSLLTDDSQQQVRVETCTTCRGYLKTVSTLSALPFHILALKDLETVAFDLAAHDRGYSRPAAQAWHVHVEIVQ